MRSFAVVAAIVGLAAAAPQAVTSAIAPNEATPAGCKADVDGTFMLVTLDSASKTKRSFQKREEAAALEVTLKGGVLSDAKGRTGYIASNNQFQFDGPVQAGAIYTAGFSLCANNSIALGDSTIFYQCLSGSFYNLYDESTGAQCSQIYLNRYVGAAAASTSGTAAATAASAQVDGQVTAGAAATVICQIGDGQVQKNTCLTPVTQIADGQVQASSAATVVSQITDGQVQATKAATSSAAVVSQITDGQVQATKAATSSVAVVSQISDGQVQATNATVITSATLTSATSAAAFTGAAAAATFKAELFGLVAGIAALAAL